MKKVLIIMFVLAVAHHIQAQDWVYDFDKAKQTAKVENKRILLVFAGSDWCGPCIKLEKSIWESDQFQKYSDKEFVLVKADFPRKKINRLSKEQQKHNDQLAEIYNQNGYFPLVLVLDYTGKVIGTTGYKNISPEAYIDLLNTFSS